MPGPDFSAHRFLRVRADRRQKRHEMPAVPVLGQSRPEFVTQERKRRNFMIATPISVLAVDDERLVRMQHQPHLLQAGRDRIPHMAGLHLAAAVHHRIVAVALKPDSRKLPDHPHIKRIVHEQVSQQRADRRPLRGTAIPCDQGAIPLRQRGTKPPLHIQQDPPLIRRNMVSNRPFHEVPGHSVEEFLDVEVDHPVTTPAPLTTDPDRVQRASARPVAIRIRMKDQLDLRSRYIFTTV